MKHLPLTEALYDYMLDISLREHPILKELREANAKLPLGIMQVAPEQAQFMQMLIKLIGAKRILELGTFTGYSALSMALALPEDGEIITCDSNPEWTNRAKPFWEKAGLSHKIHLRLGKALDSLQSILEEGLQFDFIFIDADKTNHFNYYEYALKLISPKGLIAIDNIFWEGQVIDTKDKSAQTREIRRLNEHIRSDNRVEVSLLAIADGMFLIRRANI